MKEKEKADKEAQSKAQEAKLEFKKRKISEYVDSTYNQPVDNAANNLLADEAILPDHPTDDAISTTNISQPTTNIKRSKPAPDTLNNAAKKAIKNESTQGKPKPPALNTAGKQREEGEPGHHFHVFHEHGHTYNDQDKTWYKACLCGFTVPFEKM
jgi:hypothetical protein